MNGIRILQSGPVAGNGNTKVFYGDTDITKCVVDITVRMLPNEAVRADIGVLVSEIDASVYKAMIEGRE